MEILIRNSDSQPIYEQIVRQVSGQILSGALPPGTALPSIRALARDLKISVITTKRAYDELEAAGFLYTVAGKGCFVAQKNTELIREEHLKEIEDHMRRIRTLSAACHITDEELRELYRVISQEETP